MFAPSFRLAFRARAVVALAAFAIPSGALGQQPASPPAKLPPARQIIDRYVQAIGGREAVVRHTSSHTFQTLSAPASGQTGQIESFAAAPNRRVVHIRIADLGEQVVGFDGTHGWSIDPSSGPRLVEGKELVSAREGADFMEPLHNPAKFKSIETVELTDFEGRPCYKLKLVRTNGDEYYEFFDVKTGLLAGTILTEETAMGAIESTNVVSDYKSFDGWLIPTTIIARAMQQEFRVTVDSVQFDNVPPSTFEPPEAIKTLLSAPAKPGGGQ